MTIETVQSIVNYAQVHAPTFLCPFIHIRALRCNAPLQHARPVKLLDDFQTSGVNRM
jgi:hypothetical protein